MKGRYLGVREAAKELGVHEQTVRAWERGGIIQAIRLPGSNYRRIPVEEVRRIQEEMRVSMNKRLEQRVKMERPSASVSTKAAARASLEKIKSYLRSLDMKGSVDEVMTEIRGRQ
jgi:excisionase family DNA binding protein